MTSVNIELDIPEEYEFVGLKVANKGDLYFNPTSKKVKTVDALIEGMVVFIVEKKVKHIFDLNVGQKFRFKHSHEKTIYRIVRFSDLHVTNRSKIFYIGGDCVNQCPDVFNFDKNGNREVNFRYKTRTWEVELIED